MGLKTFNLDDAVYKEFSKHCKENGISMSKRIENFIKGEVSKIKSNVKDKKDEIGLDLEHSFKKYC